MQYHLVTNHKLPISLGLRFAYEVFLQFTRYLFSLQRRMLFWGSKGELSYILGLIYRKPHIFLYFMSRKVSFCSKENCWRVSFENLLFLCQPKMGKKEPKPKPDRIIYVVPFEIFHYGKYSQAFESYLIFTIYDS